MAKITTKYRCGENVTIAHTPPTDGIVTAIFIRGRGRTYEVSFTGKDGPTNVNCEEVELQRAGGVNKLGFCK